MAATLPAPRRRGDVRRQDPAADPEAPIGEPSIGGLRPGGGSSGRAWPVGRAAGTLRSMLSSAALQPPLRSAPFVAGQLVALRVFVADDHALYRRVITRAIERHPGLALTGEAADGEAAAAAIAALEPDVALLDLRMPGLDGLEVCRRVRAGHPDVAVVVLTAFDDDDTPFRALAAGASACLGKDASEEEICRAVLAAGDATRPPAPTKPA
jgi:CheY-like chemotaxis protein